MIFLAYFRLQTVLLLVGLRGEFPPPCDASQSNLISAARGEHSAKPDEARAVIDKLYPAFGKNKAWSCSPASRARVGLRL